MQHRKITAFFLLALGLTWGLQLPGVLVKLGLLAGPLSRVMPLLGLGAFGPLAAAVVMASVEGGGVARGALFRRFARGPVALGWWLLAPSLSGGLFLAARAVAGLAGYAGPWWYVPHTAETVTAAVVFSFGEEVGWRGYALPRLLPRFGAFGASALLGLVWCLWHAMMLAVEGLPLWLLLAFAPYFVAGSLCFTWAHLRTRGNLLVAVLLHLGSHLNNSHKALPGSLTPMLLHTAAFVLFAAVVWRVDPVLRTPPAALAEPAAP